MRIRMLVLLDFTWANVTGCVAFRDAHEHSCSRHVTAQLMSPARAAVDVRSWLLRLRTRTRGARRYAFTFGSGWSQLNSRSWTQQGVPAFARHRATNKGATYMRKAILGVASAIALVSPALAADLPGLVIAKFQAMNRKFLSTGTALRRLLLSGSRSL